MKILLINHYAGSEEHGMEFRPFQLAKAWVRLGHEVVIMAGSFSHLRNTNPPISMGTLVEWIDGVQYRWLPTRSYRGNGVGRILSIVDFLRGVIAEKKTLLADWKPDAVIASSTYPFDIYPARSIARATGAKLIWEVHDLWPLSPMLLGGYSRWHPFMVAAQIAEDACCRSADAVVSILPHAMRHLETRGLDPKKYSHVPNGIDALGLSGPLGSPDESTAHEMARLRLQGKFVIGYAGSHTNFNSIETLLEAASRVPGEGITCALMGDGPAKEDLVAMAKRLGPERIVFLPRGPRATALSFLASCDAIYVGLRKDPLFQFGISMNKIFDAMLCKRPVLACYSASNDPIGDAQCGLTVPAEDSVALADAIRVLRDMAPADRCALGEAGGRFVRERHNYSTLALKFAQVIEETVAQSK